MDSKELLGKWHIGLRMAHKAHEQATAHFELRGRTLSIATVIFSTVVGTSIFAMVVLERPLERVHHELDLVTTPAGDLVAMVLDRSR